MTESEFKATSVTTIELLLSAEIFFGPDEVETLTGFTVDEYRDALEEIRITEERERFSHTHETMIFRAANNLLALAPDGNDFDVFFGKDHVAALNDLMMYIERAANDSE